ASRFRGRSSAGSMERAAGRGGARVTAGPGGFPGSGEGSAPGSQAGPRAVGSASPPVELQVQGEHVDPRLAQEAEGPTFDVLLDEYPHRVRRELPLARHPGDLVERRGRADVRIEPAGRGGDEI